MSLCNAHKRGKFLEIQPTKLVKRRRALLFLAFRNDETEEPQNTVLSAPLPRKDTAMQLSGSRANTRISSYCNMIYHKTSTVLHSI